MQGVHLDFDQAPDMSKLMAMMGSLPGNVRESLMESAANMMPKSDPRSQDAVRKNWKRIKADFMGGKVAKLMQKEGMYAITSTQSWNVKQDDLSGTNAGTNAASLMDSYAPIGISSLKDGTNRGRFLVGRIADVNGFWTINSGTFLLQDLAGLVMEISVYNFPREVFASAFPRGRELSIVDPFFKIRGDGSAGVRVDQPNEIFDYAFPQTSSKWKDLGNAFIKHCPKTALACYEMALQAPSTAITETMDVEVVGNKKPKARGQGHLGNGLNLKLEVSKILTNLSLCEFNMGSFDCSLLYAVIAFGLGLDLYKAAFRIAKALDGKGLEKEAKDFAVWYCITYGNNATAASSVLREEFKVKTEDLSRPTSGAAWISACMLKDIIIASTRVKPDLLTHVDATDGHAWLAIKQHGNSLFSKNELSAARDTYISALNCCPFAPHLLQESSFITSNKGAAWLELTTGSKDFDSGDSKTDLATDGTISMFCAAMINFYGNGRAWVRASRFMARQGRRKAAVMFLEEASKNLVNEDFNVGCIGQAMKHSHIPALQVVQDELLEISKHESKTVPRLNAVSTEEQLQQRRNDSSDENTFIDRSDERIIDKEIFDAEQFYSMNLIMLGFGPESAEKMRAIAGPTFDRKRQDYSAEFVRTRGLPDGLGDYARKILYRRFANDRLQPWSRAMGWRMAWSDDNAAHIPKEIVATDIDMVKRWHGNGALRLIFENRETLTKIGAFINVRDLKTQLRSHYDTRIRSNYVNCPNHGEVYYFGKAHLSIGFNDLSSLLNCAWIDPGEEENQSIPARFVGLEMNEFNVAKHLVIAEMLGRPEIPLETVLQSWYSTVWSRDTVEHFRDCAKAVLDAGEDTLAPHREYLQQEWRPQNVSNSRVASYLSHWLVAKPIDYKEARRLWLRNTAKQNEKIFRSISSCMHASNRIALAEYFLTGEIFGIKFQVNNLNAVGSPLFWSCPEGSPPLEEDSIFNTYTLEDLMTEDKKKTLVEMFECRTMSKMSQVRDMLNNKKLTIEIYVGKVEPLFATESGDHIVNFVTKKIQPRTISWSNVIDYFPLRDLHILGRAISSHDRVIHYAYSMNWCAEIFGCHIYDYDMIKDFAMANKILDLSLGENFGGSNPQKINALQAAGSACGADELFYFPDCDTGINSTSFVAAQMTRKYWVNHFFSCARSEVPGRTRRVGEKLSPLINHFYFTEYNYGLKVLAEAKSIAPTTLHRTSTQTYLSWTYDPNE